MIPENSVKLRTNVTRMLAPDIDKVSGLLDSEKGGVNVKDPSQGFLVATWSVSVDDDKVRLYKDGVFHSIALVQDQIADIAFCFDQTMNIVLAWRSTANDLYLRYFDSFLKDHTVMSLGKGKCPRLSLDDKRMIGQADSDVIFAYIKNNSLCYRQQRENYYIERIIVSGLHPSQRLDRIGMGGLQFQFELSSYIEDL